MWDFVVSHTWSRFSCITDVRILIVGSDLMCGKIKRVHYCPLPSHIVYVKQNYVPVVEKAFGCQCVYSRLIILRVCKYSKLWKFGKMHPFLLTGDVCHTSTTVAQVNWCADMMPLACLGCYCILSFALAYVYFHWLKKELLQGACSVLLGLSSMNPWAFFFLKPFLRLM